LPPAYGTLLLGSFPSRREAEIARDRALLHFGAPKKRLKHPAASSRLGAASPSTLQRLARLRTKETSGATSPYLGVSLASHGKHWVAEVRRQPKRYRIGGYPSDRDAAIARDRLALHVYGSKAILNFPERTASPASVAMLGKELGRPAKRFLTSRYLGVHAADGKWSAQIHTRGRTYAVVGYASERAAAQARDRMALHFLGARAKLNFPASSREPASPEALRVEQSRAFKAQTSSRYRGVTFLASHPRLPWQASLFVRGTDHKLGGWDSERAAALAVDRARLYYGGDRRMLNFPALASKDEPADAATLREEAYRAFKAYTTSRFRGVYLKASAGRWAAMITHRRRKVPLGLFDDEESAALAYDRAAARLHGEHAKPNFPDRKRPRRSRR
jgi:hypothetical protein